jgi:hypothetical protein
MKHSLFLLSLLALLLLTAVTAAAAAGDTLSWWTADGGGGTSSAAGGYSLSGSIGQADAGSLSGGDYRLQGGFWGVTSSGKATLNLYLPLILR